MRGILILGLAVLSGCTMGPKYARPTVAAPAVHRGADAAAAPSVDSMGAAAWETVFVDPVLQKLIRQALAQNPDVQMAAARILAARAQVGVTRADQFPTLNGNGGVSRSRSPSSPIFPGFEANQSQLTLSAAWQLDFWGRYRRATEAARANLAASEWGKRAVINTLIANVATAYYQLRELDLEMEIAQRTLAARKEFLGLTQTLERGGSVALIDVHQAEKLVERAARTVPDLERRIEQQENLIRMLLGETPAAVERGVKLAEQPLPVSIPAGLPSALLERRPDIRQAELRLVQANAQIGVARAMMFPQISLTGTGGFQSYSVTGLFDSRVFNIGASLTQPIFDAGRIRNNIRLTEAQKEEMLTAYRQSIQVAFRETADALVAFRKNREYRERQEALTVASEQAAKLAGVRYRGGASSYLEVLTGETDWFDAELDLAAARLNERLALVQVYNALGGGWKE